MFLYITLGVTQYTTTSVNNTPEVRNPAEATIVKPLNIGKRFTV